ncbi:MAG TPA: hypothetical protein VL225_15630 [Vicinamibacterales bacterium]|nr:hypothetical protein [Vicinamibacterales bacterium]
MKRVDRRFLCLWVAVAGATIAGAAQERPATSTTNDPRVGLKAGFRDAGQAARNLELIATLPKAPGFFDPNAPAGTPSAPRGSGANGATTPASPAAAPPASGTGSATAGTSTAAAAPSGRGATPPGGGLNFANSDIAFRKADLFLGNFNGFNAYDIETPKKPRLLASVVCPGGQGDMSVYGNLLFMSVEQTRGRVDCGTQGVADTASPERFRGVRIFDISDISKPRQVAAVQTCRGSHTHTLVTDPTDSANIYVYGSGTSSVRPGEELAGCSGKDPNEDPDTALFSIDVIKVPLAAPQKAAIVNRPRIFADEKTGAIAGLEKGGDRGPGTQPARTTNQCHDITVYPEVGLAAGACSGNGILLDISDPVHPVRLDAVADKNFAYWHSATFNNDGTKIVFTDEWGGGTQPRCRATDPLNWGADAIFDIVDRKLQFRGYFKMPAAQTEQENCVAHNGSIVPVPGRDIMVQGWYQGGVSVFDFTDSAHPIEIAFFDRGPLDPNSMIVGGYWSAYWYNGRIYGSEIARGVDVFRLTPSDQLSQNEIDAASLVRMDEFNPQKQPKVSWPASFTVARAYLDQLNRSHALSADRAAAAKSAIDKAGKDKPSKAALDQVDKIAGELERGADSASGIDAAHMKALAAAMKARAAKLRA